MWNAAAHLVETLIRLSTSLVMTRLLVPGDFGLMAIALVFPASLAMLTDFGIRDNVIRKSVRLGTKFLRTAWTMQVVRGVVLSLLMLVSAGLFLLPGFRLLMPEGSLLLHPQLPFLLAAVGAAPLIGAFESVNIYVQERDIKFGPLIWRTIISKILPVPVMIVWALFYPSVWSLIVGMLVAQIVLTISSHILIPGPTMKFRWNTHHVHEFLGDGKWIALSTAGTFFVSQGDRLILATLFSATEMGLYVIAWTLADVARSFLLRIHSAITLPVLSELFRTRPEKAIDAYYRYRRPIDILAFSGTGFLWMAGPEIIHFLYDERYLDAGWILQVLTLSLALFPFQMINLAFIANDEWRNYSFNSVILTLSFFSAAFIGYLISDSTGVIWAIAVYSCPATLVLLTRAYRRGWVDPVREIVMLPFIFVGGSLGFAVRFLLQWMETLL